MMLLKQSMKKILAARGYHHCKSDDRFTRHGDYARNSQYVFSKEFLSGREKIVDLIYLSADMVEEKIVIGFFRENVTIENGVLENSDISIPFQKFSLDEFVKKLDKLIPRGSPVRVRPENATEF